MKGGIIRLPVKERRMAPSYRASPELHAGAPGTARDGECQNLHAIALGHPFLSPRCQWPIRAVSAAPQK